MTSRTQSEPEPIANSSADSTPSGFTERLWPSPGVWSIAIWFGLMMFLAFLAVSFAWAALAFAVAAAGAVVAMVLGSPTITVANGTVSCGRASIEIEFVGDVTVLDESAVALVRGRNYNPHAFMCQRAWLRQGVTFTLTDPNDPTPYWFLSSRKPKALAAAIERAKAK